MATTARDRLAQALEERGITDPDQVAAIVAAIADDNSSARMDYVSLPVLTALLHEMSNRLEATIDAKIANQIAPLRAELRTEIQTLSDKTDARFDKIDDRFDKTDARFDKTEDRFDRIEKRIDDLVAVVTEMNNRHAREMRELAEQSANDRAALQWRVAVLVTAIVAAAGGIAAAVIAALT